MLRKFTASVLLLLTMAVTATAQPGLNWCLCLHTVFVGECECEELALTGECSIQNTGASCDCNSVSTRESTELGPCDDCSIDLSFEIDDFLSGAFGEILSKPSNLDFHPSLPPHVADVLASVSLSEANATRGPPPFLVVSPVPLFIRHSVFLV